MNGAGSGTIVERWVGRPSAAPRIVAQRPQLGHGLRRQATPTGDGLDTLQLIALLNDALATEWVCALRHRQHYYACKAGTRRGAASSAWRLAMAEFDHADRIATRILELGGEPDLDPDRLSARSHAMYRQRPGPHADSSDDLGAELAAIDSLREMLEIVGDHDPRTRRLLEDVLAVEDVSVRHRVPESKRG